MKRANILSEQRYLKSNSLIREYFEFPVDDIQRFKEITSMEELGNFANENGFNMGRFVYDGKTYLTLIKDGSIYFFVILSGQSEPASDGWAQIQYVDDAYSIGLAGAYYDRIRNSDFDDLNEVDLGQMFKDMGKAYTDKIPQMTPAEKQGSGIKFRSLMDGELGMAGGSVFDDSQVPTDFRNYKTRNEFISKIEDRLMQSDWIELSDGTTFEKSFSPKSGGLKEEAPSYSEIGRFSSGDIESQEYTQEQLIEIGEYIVDNEFGGDIHKAYKEIVKKGRKEMGDPWDIDNQ